jgi:3-oxoacyl-[acyl-carrier-protein] synthase-3
MGATATVRMESLGVYLPPTVLTMEELLASCRRRPRWDLEAITGIRERRVAVGEHAADLAVEAARRALAGSRYAPGDLGAIVCTSISRHNAPDRYDLEPATAVLVRRALGAGRALVFDLVNACAGMFTGIWVLQGLIRSGAVKAGMVVSGEENMPLARTAAREVRHSFDRQLAAFTLGDAGAAIVLDRSPDDAHGFHHLELVTGARHHHYCHSRPSSRGTGGVLITKARGLQRKGAEHFPAYLKRALDATGWSFDDLDHVIPHQVSVRAIRQGVKVVDRYLGVATPDVYRCTADRYANTTTTSHFVALHDLIRRGLVNPEERILLVSGASGIVIAHATLTTDGLPDRYRERWGREG